MKRAVAIIALLAAACESMTPAGPTFAPAPVAAPAPPDLAAPRDLGPAPLAHLVLRGRALVPGGMTGQLVLAATDGPCFQTGTHYLAVQRPAPGQPFTFDLYPPRRSAVEVCAALVTAGQRTTRFWARASKGPFAVGTVEGVDVLLARQEPVALPSPFSAP